MNNRRNGTVLGYTDTQIPECWVNVYFAPGAQHERVYGQHKHTTRDHAKLFVGLSRVLYRIHVIPKDTAR